ncbi:MAG: bifunctional proline dehydrogenase/L-glutamate gamma-semialdehyde dehydrogenase PutA [Oceanococcaceae bacterium]
MREPETTLSALSARMAADKFAPEAALLHALCAELRPQYPAEAVFADACRIVEASRAQRSRQGTLDAFLNEFGLSNQEGITLMCLAEALLRVPDADTQDALIAEKILAGDWDRHRGHSDKLFVNAGVWALMLTGRVLDADAGARDHPGRWLRRLVARSGEGAIRGAVRQAMAIMGGQFVFGQDIEEALDKRARRPASGQLYSFDMLGEAARTGAAAQEYAARYRHAIDALGALPAVEAPARSSISIKLSALHPRYSHAQRDRVFAELLPRVRELVRHAAQCDVPVTIDAEETDRLALSLELFEVLARDPQLRGWNGLGLAVQAYQKRARTVIDWLVALTHETGRQIPVRLVKGAYWDTEIKQAQVAGHADYPVFTHKPATDLAYLACARAMLDAGAALYPQFATHNAHTIAAVHHMAGARPFEFQRLHGMGELLYAAARKSLIGERVPLRVYAPIGAHADLLPYLVRRLLENGANSSFVHRFLNESQPIAEVVADPLQSISELLAEQAKGAAAVSGTLPLPADIHGPERRNARGFDLAAAEWTDALAAHMAARREAGDAFAAGIVNGADVGGAPQPASSPADQRRVIGHIRWPEASHRDDALRAACAAQPAWDRRGGAARADILCAMGDALEADHQELLHLLTAEAGRTWPDAVAELREAVDFCRYYAAQARRLFDHPQPLPGPTGEANTLELHGRGVFLCISPWNFPLAIFTGQLAAALAAGNAVLAKPAEQTSLVAHRATRAFLRAGVPAKVLQLLPGTGPDMAAPLVADSRIAGVAFTGSTATAKRIQRTLAEREGEIVPLIAETGGQNAMIVDSTALLEQACDDILESAFGSAGQRCSALRVLLVQDAVAEPLLAMLREALAERRLGPAWALSTDIGPVIDATARARLNEHIARMDREARLVAIGQLPDDAATGLFCAPRIYEIDALARLHGEVFGPVLHVLRWNAQSLPAHLAALHDTGYGLTFGLHSRLDGMREDILPRVRAGNVYVNRTMVGAVVGVQPFGGSGLSGTGPKAGGPHYLPRFATERTVTINTAAIGGNAELFARM